MKTLIAFTKTNVVLIFMIGILVPAALSAQNPEPELSPIFTNEYCIPFSDCSYGDGFENFGIMNIDNYFSGCSEDGYGDYTWMTTQLNAGESYSLYAETGYDGNYFCVWIDYNDDFDFTLDEMIVEDAYMEFGAQLYEVEVSIPEDALSGVHRMRAKAVWGYTATDACADNYDGETEDYSVEIISGSGFTDIGIVSIDIEAVISPGPIYPRVTLQNFGTETFTQQVSIINDAGYGTSAIIYDMLPGEVRQISYAEWNAQVGVYTFHAYSSYVDDNPDNDQLFKEVTVEIPNVEPPQNPEAIVDGNALILNWEAPAGKEVIGYRVYNNEIRIADSLTQTSYTDFCLTNGNYSYTITALYNVGESVPSDAAEISIDLCELTLVEEGFEAYNGEQQLVVQAQAMDIDYWHCWSLPAGSQEDPNITNEVVMEGQKSMVIQDLNDVILELGGKTEGKWEVRFNIYVPSGFDGFFGIWREISSLSTGIEVYFDANETGATIIANSNWEWFTYQVDTWNTIVASLDLDNDWGKIYINGEMIAQSQWSLDQSGEPAPKKLDCIDFYAGTLWEGEPKSFVDNIRLQRIVEDALPPENLLTEVNLNNVMLSWDAPMEGIIGYEIYRDDEAIGNTSLLTYLDENLESGEYQYEILADYGLCQSPTSTTETTLVYPIQVITIPAGWSGLSGYLEPSTPDIEHVFQEVPDDLIILQNESGIYWPGQNINTLLNWDSHSGYKIKALENISLTLCGPWPANKTIQLSEGWNLIPVLSECDVEVTDLFSMQEVILIKEIAGNSVYWPEYDIHSLEFLQSGKAYYVLMDSAGNITFPECE